MFRVEKKIIFLSKKQKTTKPKNNHDSDLSKYSSSVFVSGFLQRDYGLCPSLSLHPVPPTSILCFMPHGTDDPAELRVQESDSARVQSQNGRSWPKREDRDMTSVLPVPRHETAGKWMRRVGTRGVDVFGGPCLCPDFPSHGRAEAGTTDRPDHRARGAFPRKGPAKCPTPEFYQT